MIPVHELVSSDALSRYDDNGDPAYTTYERVLLVMRWFDWVSQERIVDALEAHAPGDGIRITSAIAYHARKGTIAKRVHLGTMEYRLVPKASRIASSTCRRCPLPVKSGYIHCTYHVHVERERARKRKRATGSHTQHCGSCGEVGHNARCCDRKVA